MDGSTKANGNSNAQPQLVSLYPLQDTRSPRIFHIATAILISVNLLLSVLIIRHVEDGARYAAGFFLTWVLLCIQVASPVMFGRLDYVYYPNVVSWILAIIVSVTGAVYPACFHTSKLHWVVISGWIMFVAHVLVTALQYYVYYSPISSSPVHPVFPGA